jgi:hypothetical protein
MITLDYILRELTPIGCNRFFHLALKLMKVEKQIKELLF